MKHTINKSHTINDIIDVKIKQTHDVITTNNNSPVIHGEHGTIKLESKNVIAYIQQELNPITGVMQDAFD